MSQAQPTQNPPPAPPPSQEDTQPAKTQMPPDEAARPNGCLWGLTGAIGCVAILVGLFFGLIFITGSTIASLIGDFPIINLSGLFGERIEVTVPTGVVLPPIEPIQALSELTTTRYNYANIVSSQSDMPAVLARLYGESLVMVAVGHIEAGVNINEITTEDLTFDAESGVLTLRLPAPTLQSCFLNENESYVAERRTGLFARPSPDLDSDSRRFALRQFRDQALEEGILEETANEAEAVMREFLSVVVPDVPIQIEMAPIDLSTQLPDTCQ